MPAAVERPRQSAAAEADSGHSWAEQIKTYERTRRHDVDPGKMQKAPMQIDTVQVKLQERAWDPLLARFRDQEKEHQQRTFESGERLRHLNRAKDIQILREVPYDIINHKSRLDQIGGEPQSQPSNEASHPRTCCDFNIVSNLPLAQHHCDRPENRPWVGERHGKEKKVPAINLKDFNIVSNRYLRNHEGKEDRDRTLNALEATSKFRLRNRFDPVKQVFTCPREEERQRTCEDACTSEILMRGQAAQPPSYHGRHSAFYDAVTHSVHDHGMLEAIDFAEHARTTRYRTGHQKQANLKHQEILFEDAHAAQRHSQIAHERFEEVSRRGYDIVTSQAFGSKQGEAELRKPFTTPRQTVWEKVQANRDDVVDVYRLPEANGPPSVGRAHVGVSTPRGPGSVQSGRSASRGATPRSGYMAATPRSGSGMTPTFLTGALAGAGAQMSATPRPPPMAGGTIGGGQALARAPPPPVIPGSPVGSSYSRPKVL